jgi:antitoxin VapB
LLLNLYQAARHSRSHAWERVTMDKLLPAAYARHMPIHAKTAPERRVKVFKNGRNRAVRIPREFECPGNEAIMRKEGNRLIIEPARPKSLLELLASLKPLDEDFEPIHDSPPEPVDL